MVIVQQDAEARTTGDEMGDLTTLAEPSIVDALVARRTATP
jgi:hypothetical protein